MISFDKMTSPILTGSIRKEIGGCMATPPSQFKPGHIVIRIMCCFLRSDEYWWDSSAIHHWDPNTHLIGINIHMGEQ